MRIRRLHNPNGWTSIPNALIEDRALSWRARGLLVYLLSRPDNWETDSDRLAEQAGLAGDARQSAAEGRDAVRRAMREAEDAGYLHRVKRQTQRGNPDRRAGTWTTEMYVTDHPTSEGIPGLEIAQNPPVDPPVDNPVEDWSPTPEKPNVGKPGPINNTKNHVNPATPDELPSKTSAPVENGAGDAGAASPRLAALADDEPAMPALSPTDAIAMVSRLEPGVQMFALRAHLLRVLGYQLGFDQVAALVVEAHECTTPSQRGRLRDRDIIDWVEEFTSPPGHDSGYASVEGSDFVAVPQRGLPAPEPA